MCQRGWDKGGVSNVDRCWAVATLTPWTPDNEINDFFDRIGPMSDEEKAEALLNYLGVLINDMSKDQLLALRARCAGKHPGIGNAGRDHDP